jgi:hypothetical protein
VFLFCLCPPWLSDETDKLTWMSAVQCRRSILGGHASLGQHLQGLGRLHRKQVSVVVCVCVGGGANEGGWVGFLCVCFYVCVCVGRCG